MKRTFTSFVLVLFTLLMTATTAKAEATQSADREKINGIMMEMINEWDHEAFTNAAGLIGQVAQFDLSAVAGEAIVRLVGMKKAIEGTPNFNLLFSGKELGGHFVVKDGKWEKESDADDLQFTYSVNGVPCVLKMTTSDNTKTTVLPLSMFSDLVKSMGADDDDDSGYEARRAEDDDSPSMMEIASMFLKEFMKDVTVLSFEVPEKTTIDLTLGGKPLMTAAINADLSSIGQTPLDGLVISSSVKFNKGVIDEGTGSFEMSLTNTGYKPGTGINLDFSAKKDDKQILGFKVSAPGTIDLQNLIGGDGSINLGLSSLNIEIDAMGKAQLKGDIADLNQLVMLAMAANQIDEPTEEQAKGLMAQLNQLVNVNLYYTGQSTPAATMQFVAQYDEDWNEWDGEARVVFASDNSSYGVGEFFSQENFPEVMQGLMGIVGELAQVAQTVAEDAQQEVMSVKTAKQQTAVAEYYTLDGKRTTAAAKGLKIVRMSDGSVRKVMTK